MDKFEFMKIVDDVYAEYKTEQEIVSRMKQAEELKKIGATIFWTFFFGTSIIDIITHFQGCSDLWFWIMRQVFAGFELFGISLEIAGLRLIRKEIKRIKKESEEIDNE